MLRGNPVILVLATALILGGCTVNINQQAVATATIPAAAATTALPTAKVPVTWSSLNLSGHLVFLVGTQEDNNPAVILESLDLRTGLVNPIFQAPPPGWIYAASVSPDKKQIVLSYATPTAFPVLYIMPLDGSYAPRLLFPPPNKADQYTEPVWSPDGKDVYYVHVNFGQQAGNQKYPVFEIERMATPHGAPERLLTNAYWPRLSPDGSIVAVCFSKP